MCVCVFLKPKTVCVYFYPNYIYYTGDFLWILQHFLKTPILKHICKRPLLENHNVAWNLWNQTFLETCSEPSSQKSRISFFLFVFVLYLFWLYYINIYKIISPWSKCFFCFSMNVSFHWVTVLRLFLFLSPYTF